MWASVEKTPRKVIRTMFDEALSRDPERCRRWIVLVDGEPKQLAAVKAEARRVGVKVTILLDVVHVIEYVWKAARALFGESNAEATKRPSSRRSKRACRCPSSEAPTCASRKMARQRRSRERRLGFAQRAKARGSRKCRGSTCMQASPCALATAKDSNACAATARGRRSAWSACAILADGRVAYLPRTQPGNSR